MGLFWSPLVHPTGPVVCSLAPLLSFECSNIVDLNLGLWQPPIVLLPPCSVSSSWILLLPYNDPGLPSVAPAGVSWDPISSEDCTGRTSNLVQLIFPPAGLEPSPFISSSISLIRVTRDTGCGCAYYSTRAEETEAGAL